MVTAAVIVLVLVLIASAGVMYLVRGMLTQEERVEEHMHDPHTHTITYAIPNGVDPVVVKVALSTAGFTSVVDRTGNTECLLVEAEESERAQVRSTIEGVHMTAYDGSSLKLGHVVFEDER